MPRPQDGDGHVDVFTGQTWTSSGDEAAPYVYRNFGGGDHTKVPGSPFDTDAVATNDVTFGDIDGDGDLDLFVANGPRDSQTMIANHLYVNRGSEGWSKVTSGVISSDTALSNQAKFVDVDGDGDLDLFVANGLPGSTTQAQSDYTAMAVSNFLYLNDGSGTFTRAASAGPTAEHSASAAKSFRCAVFADIDNDVRCGVSILGPLGYRPARPSLLHARRS